MLGSVYNVVHNKKLNTLSLTEAERVAAADVIPKMLWTHQFLLSQDVEVGKKTLYQKNFSAMLLEKNGMTLSSKRTRHINVRYLRTNWNYNNVLPTKWLVISLPN
jgi:hypothetical protein